MSSAIRRFFILHVCVLLINFHGIAQCDLQIRLVDKNDPVCYGTPTGSAVAEATNGAEPYTFIWTNGTNVFTGPIQHYIPLGNYTLTVTDANHCSASLTFSLTQPPPITHTINISDATCGLLNGKVLITPADGVAPYKYRWSDDLPHGSSPNDLAPGTYTVTIKDANGCEDVFDVAVVNKGGVHASISNTTDATCFGVSNGSATVRAEPDGPYNYTYLWSPAGGNAATASNLAAGNYSVVVTDTVGCTATAFAQIAQPAEIVASITKHDATCGNKNGEASVIVNAPAGSYTYLWTPGNYTTPTISGVAAGTYTVTITNEKNCKKILDVVIDGVSIPTITEMKHTDILCNGQQNGTAAAIVRNGVLPYSFLWTSGTNTYTDSSLTGLGVGTYQLAVKDRNGCVAQQSVTIAEPSVLAHSVSVLPVTCNHATGSATINETGGNFPYTFLWKPGDQTGATASGLAVGEYVVYINDKNQCTDSAHISIVSAGTLTVAIDDVKNVTCNGGNDGSATAYASGTGPYSFSWSTTGTTNAVAANLKAGSYTVTVTDQLGCTANATAVITEPAPITTQIKTVAASCGNDNGSATVVAGGGTGAFTFTWQPGNYIGANVNNLAAGNYTLTTKDANGCMKTEEVIIKGSGKVSITKIAAADVVCNGQQTGSAAATVTGGTSPYTYNWTKGASTYAGNPLQNVAVGTYQLTVSDAAGCSATGSVTINQPAPLSHTVNITTATCGNQNGAAKITESGGTAPYTYNWSPSGGNTSSASTLSLGNYISYISDAHQCTDSVHVQIINVGGVTATMSNAKDVSCYGGNNGSAAVHAVSTATPLSYAWSPAGGTSATAVNLAAGDYSVLVTDQQGCTATASTRIAQPNILKTIVTNINTTCNNTNGSASVVASGGVAPYTYNWAGSLYSTPIISNLAAGHYLLTVADAHGCSVNDSAVIQPSTNPVIDSISKTNVLCNGKQDGTATAYVSKGIKPYAYVWSNGTDTYKSFSIEKLAAATYQLKITDAAGCVATSGTSITEPTALKVSVLVTPTTCGATNGSALLTVSGGITPYLYQWSTGNRSNALSNTAGGTYQAVCTDANGCTSTVKDIKINGSLPLRVSLGKDTSICPGTNYILTPGNFKSYAWNDNSTNSTCKAMQTGMYTVTVTDTVGCTASASVKIEVDCKDIVFPNAFTPNSDGHNDSFGPLGSLAAVKDYTMHVYNRWGQVVFSTNNPYVKWDGKFNISENGTGTFVWIASYSFNGQPKRLQKGTITLIK